MTTFRSCHLIVNRKLPDDRRHVHDFIDADFFHCGDISTIFLEWTPSTNITSILAILLILGEMLNISTTNDST